MKYEIQVCTGPGCLANGALGVAASLKKAAGGKAEVKMVKETGCKGLCECGPVVTVEPEGVAYYNVREKDAEDIINSLGKEPVKRLLFDENTVKISEHPFYRDQKKIALRNTGTVDPVDIDDYIEKGGYEGLKKALKMDPENVIAEVEKSKLRGRGGAGFPTAVKWRSCAKAEGDEKYMLCNGDEGDPGAFMDRSLLEGDPHNVLEGLIIGAYAISAHRGFFYIRDEYGIALKHVQKAINDARERGFLGNDICGSGFGFDCEIVRGGGAFVCGESSALMTSIEGKVGEPRVKYIRSVEKGLFDKPTVLNNVETLANVPYILGRGGDSYAKYGTENSKGTKVFSLVGKVNRTGLVEVPMGTSLRHLIFDIGGGIKDGGKFKGVQTGGPSGGCIPEELLDLPIDYDTLKANGSMMGSGGMIVMDESTCMVELARYYMSFLAGESCGKCTPCREGLRCMLDILTRITEGNGRPEDIDLLEELAYAAQQASLCELGRTAANPIMSTIKYFRGEYEEHIREHRCRAHVCRALITYSIDPDKCKSCGLCAKNCASDAISGAKKEAYRIDQTKCVKCGGCMSVCRFGAVLVE